MSKQREALELALDALSSDSQDIMLRASVAIREALAEPEKANQCGETCERAKLCAVCANGLAEPEQEPVAHNFGDVTEMAARKPLTDAEMRQCANAMDAEPLAEGWKELIKFARAIEQAHGITE